MINVIVVLNLVLSIILSINVFCIQKKQNSPTTYSLKTAFDNVEFGYFRLLEGEVYVKQPLFYDGFTIGKTNKGRYLMQPTTVKAKGNMHQGVVLNIKDKEFDQKLMNGGTAPVFKESHLEMRNGEVVLVVEE